MLTPSPITLSQAQAQLDAWLAALSAASSGSSYSIGGRTLTRQDIGEIRAEIQRWHTTVTAIQQRSQGNVRPMGAQASFPAPGSGSGGIIPQSLWTDWRT